jgi:hypothetical protein
MMGMCGAAVRRSVLMIECAGMDPEAPNRARPRALDRAIHQPTAGAAADEGRYEAKEAELAFAGDTEVELQQSGFGAAGFEHINFNQRIMDDRGERRVRHGEPGGPDPVFADVPEKISKPRQFRPRGVLQDEGRIRGLRARRRPLQHFERGDDGGDLAGRHVREAHSAASAAGCQSIGT